MGGDEAKNNSNREESKGTYIGGIIKEFYEELLKFDCQYKDLYEMTITELESTLINKRKGLAYRIWRLATFTRSPFASNFPSSPKEAMPELYPKEVGIPMPDFLKEKAMKRGVI